jgi:hypothetical protein
MDDPHADRMAKPHRRGPAPASTPTPLPMPAEVVEFTRPPEVGIRPPCCGRAMVPRRVATSGAKVYAACTFCGASLVMTFDAAGRPATVRQAKNSG